MKDKEQKLWDALLETMDDGRLAYIHAVTGIKISERLLLRPHKPKKKRANKKA